MNLTPARRICRKRGGPRSVVGKVGKLMLIQEQQFHRAATRISARGNRPKPSFQLRVNRVRWDHEFEDLMGPYCEAAMEKVIGCARIGRVDMVKC